MYDSCRGYRNLLYDNDLMLFPCGAAHELRRLDPVVGIHAGKRRKMGWAKPLPRRPAYGALNRGVFCRCAIVTL
jgi:hypothetical protein